MLTELQLKHGYFATIGGFPPDKILHECSEYTGQEKICVACTQLPSLLEGEIFGFTDVKYYSNKDQKRILQEWIDFFHSNKTSLKAVHFNSRVPRKLFNAVCCQENLVELRCKWGDYDDLSPLKNLPKLQYLYLGQGSKVVDIEPLSELQQLRVLYVRYFKKIEDYSPLSALNNLEQLVIGGSPGGSLAPVKDLEFSRDMKGLRSLLLRGVRVKKKYTDAQWEELYCHGSIGGYWK
jgi:Leucine-rich repeat (LRR) protein